MSRRNRKRKFVEDEFDLDEFIQTTELSTYRKFRKKAERYINFISVIIMILAFIIAYLAYSILNYYIELWQNKKISELAQNIYETADIPAPVSAPVVLPSGASPETPPGSPEPMRIRQEFLDMMNTFNNSDIVGYLVIDGTKISYPVVKGNDNEFYLNHDLNKNQNVAGSVFMDYENRVDVLGYNTVIYGHNMKNESMFHNLRYYKDKDFFDEHRYITFKTLYEDTRWDIFAFYETDTQFDYIKTHFVNQEDFYTLVSAMKEKSMYDTGVGIIKEDKIITLSTCTNSSDDSRYTLNAKLIKD